MTHEELLADGWVACSERLPVRPSGGELVVLRDQDGMLTHGLAVLPDREAAEASGVVLTPPYGWRLLWSVSFYSCTDRTSTYEKTDEWFAEHFEVVYWKPLKNLNR